MDIHEMEGYREGNVIICNCPVCGRRVIVNEEGLSIAEPGDTSANHRGGMEMRVDYMTQLLLSASPLSAGWIDVTSLDADPDGLLPPQLDS